MFSHELSTQYCTIVYPTGLLDERKQPNPQGVSGSINCVLPTGKSGMKY